MGCSGSIATDKKQNLSSKRRISVCIEEKKLNSKVELHLKEEEKNVKKGEDTNVTESSKQMGEHIHEIQSEDVKLVRESWKEMTKQGVFKKHGTKVMIK